MLQLENPLHTNGFAFLEFATINKNLLDKHFINLGFTKIGQAEFKDVAVYQQGGIFFFVDSGSNEKSREFAKVHGDSTSAMGFYVKNANNAFELAIKRGAVAFNIPQDSIWVGIPAIEGIGGSAIYFVEEDNKYLSRFNINHPNLYHDYGLHNIDHVTHNVYRGNMAKWADFYTNIFGFRQIRYFDIDGKMTGLFSKAMTSPCGKIKIPLNESKDDKSQIEEFLKEFNGEGIQHIALTSRDIFSSVAQIYNSGVELLNTPDTYYELIDTRLPNHGEYIEQLKKFRILIDGTTTPQRKLLLQIFTQNLIGPTFFEIIQRKGDEGFGEGNFKALFDSIELDQVRRGVLTGYINATI
ncbi:MAG: 4-hydroxyphenylpyruvate dioxygenase [Burkholderiales bacterium]|nr:4-hydroxyphenylpyruvate dioxygenase [Burkholderiales bacterium]